MNSELYNDTLSTKNVQLKYGGLETKLKPSNNTSDLELVLPPDSGTSGSFFKATNNVGNTTYTSWDATNFSGQSGPTGSTGPSISQTGPTGPAGPIIPIGTSVNYGIYLSQGTTYNFNTSITRTITTYTAVTENGTTLTSGTTMRVVNDGVYLITADISGGSAGAGFWVILNKNGTEEYRLGEGTSSVSPPNPAGVSMGLLLPLISTDSVTITVSVPGLTTVTFVDRSVVTFRFIY